MGFLAILPVFELLQKVKKVEKTQKIAILSGFSLVITILGPSQQANYREVFRSWRLLDVFLDPQKKVKNLKIVLFLP